MVNNANVDGYLQANFLNLKQKTHLWRDSGKTGLEEHSNTIVVPNFELIDGIQLDIEGVVILKWENGSDIFDQFLWIGFEFERDVGWDRWGFWEVIWLKRGKFEFQH